MPYSPAEAPWPGWQFYASVNFGPQGGLWRDLPELNAYVARCQSVLQAGAPDDDVLLYYAPHDAWDAAGELLLQNPVPQAFDEAGLRLWRRGFAWDAVSERACRGPRRRAGGCASAPAAIGRSSSRAIRLITPDAVQRLAALARDGATVVLVGGRPPTSRGGTASRPVERSSAGRSGRLDSTRGGTSSRRITVGKGSVLVGDDVERLLAQAGVAREPMTDAGVRFVRRAHPRGADYFLVNRGAAPVDGWVTLGRRPARLYSSTRDLPSARRGGAPARSGERGVPAARPRRVGGAADVRSDPAPGNPGPYVEAVGPAEPVAGPWRLAFVERDGASLDEGEPPGARHRLGGARAST